MITEELKNSILLSAFQGKLSERNVNDTDVESTLSLIRDEKTEFLLNNKNIKKTKIDQIPNEEKPFLIPDNWLWVRWGTLSNSIQYGVNAGAKETGNVKLVRISDINNNDIDWESVPFSSIEEKNINQFLLKENDILFARTGGTVGKSVVVRNIPTDNTYVFAGYLIRSNYSQMVNYKYLKFFMESSLYWDQLKKGTIGSAQPNCNGQTLSKMIIPFPPIEEQQRIVDKIEEIFSVLNETRHIEEELKTLKIKFSDVIKKSILMHYTHSNKNEKIRMEEIVNVKTGKKNANYGSENGKYLFFTCARDPMWADGFSFDSEAILLAGNGDISNINYYVGKFEAYQRTYVLTNIDTKKLNMKYLYYHLRASWAEYNNYQIYGSAIPYIKLDNLKKYFVHCPPIEEQKRIVEKIEELLPLCEDIDSMVNT